MLHSGMFVGDRYNKSVLHFGQSLVIYKKQSIILGNCLSYIVSAVFL